MKNFLLPVFLCISLLTACNQQTGKNGKSEGSSEMTVNPEKVVLVNMDVRGMTCSDCENTIKAGISELNGIVDVTADFKAGNAMVECDTSITSIADLTQAIENRGYSVAGSKIEAVTKEMKSKE